MLKMILQPVSVCVGLLLRVRLRLSQKLTEDAALKKNNHFSNWSLECYSPSRISVIPRKDYNFSCH